MDNRVLILTFLTCLGKHPACSFYLYLTVIEPTTPEPPPPDPACDQRQPTLIIVLGQGFLLSPNYPVFYENNLECSWIIDVDIGKTVQLTFIVFHLEDG